MTRLRAKRFKAAIFRINISYLSENTFGKFPVLGKNEKRKVSACPKLDHLKSLLVDLLWAQEQPKGLTNYTVAWQTHQSNGLAHLDILLRYEKAVYRNTDSYKLLLKLCPQDVCHFSTAQGRVPQLNLTPYASSRLCQAVLDYGQKEDPSCLSNFTYKDSNHYLLIAAIKADPFAYLDRIMDKDPYNFDLSYYAKKYDLIKHIPCWSTVKNKLIDSQNAAIALTQQAKPGLKLITRATIESSLSPSELATFDTYPCFQTIVDYLNQIPTHGPARPHKTMNLLIHGPKHIGKTSFLEGSKTSLSAIVPSYTIKVENKYLNRYYNNIYGFIRWNQMKMTDFSPTWILELLEGCVELSIPMRYNSCIKRDNPLIIATSNLSLDAHLKLRFGDRPELYRIAAQNLSVRIESVHVPVPMFFMQKLLIPKPSQPIV